jgi:hypothetical protein
MTATRSKRAGAISSIGLTGAPSQASPIAGDVELFPEVPTPREPVKPRRHEPVTSRRRFEAPPATSSGTTSYTLRLDVADADEVDELRTALRRTTGRRALDQSAIIRALLTLAIDDDAVRSALVRVLS